MGAGHRHVQTAEKTPLGNMWVSVAEKFDVEVESVGGSNGKVDLKGLRRARTTRSVWPNGLTPVGDLVAFEERHVRTTDRFGMWLAILFCPRLWPRRPGVRSSWTP